MKNIFKPGLYARNELKGHLFVLPFYIGFLIFFLRPILESIIFSFSDVSVGLSGFTNIFVGLDNFNFILFKDTNYLVNLIESIIKMLRTLPLILISSIFFAMILNQKFKCRVFVRAVFFLPVIIASGLVLNIVQSDFVAGSLLSGSSISGGEITQSSALRDLLTQSGFTQSIISTVTTISDTIFNTIWKTGIQTVIFLAGIQSIPKTLYEAAAVEGATSWENFWKITLPMLVPIMLVNVVYTIVDFFTDPSNATMQQILNNTDSIRFGWASAMAWFYFIAIAAVLTIIMMIFSRLTKSLR